MASPSPRMALASTFVSNFSQFGARVVISPFVPAIALTFGATKASIGIVLTVLWGSFALAHYPSGVLADRFGAARVIRIALVLVAAGSVVIAISPGLWAFTLGCVVLGIGAGSYFPTGQTYLSHRFDETGHGQALSLHAAGGPVAGIVFPAIAVAIAFRYDWRAGIGVGTAAAMIVATIVWWTLRGESGGSATVDVRGRLRPENVTALLVDPAVLTTLALGIGSMYLVQAFVSFYPTFLQEFHGLSEGAASLYFGGAFLVVAVSLPIIGRLADRYRVERVLLVPFGTMAIAMTLLVGSTTTWAVLIGSALVGIGLAGGGAIAKRAMEHFEAGTRGTGFGILRMLFVLVGSLANVVTGTLAQFWGWVPAYGVLVGVSLMGLALVTVLVAIDPPTLAPA